MATPYSIVAAVNRFPLLGHVPQLIRQPLELFRWLRAQGDIVIIRLGRAPAYVINHPDLIRQLLVSGAKDFEKGLQFEKARPYIGNGILTSNGPLHLRQRRLMQPAFHQAQVARYAEVMRKGAAAMLESWRHGQEVAMNEQFLVYTVKVLTRALFSTEVEAGVISEFTDAMTCLLEGLTVRVALPFRFFERLPTRGNRRFNEGRVRLRAIIKRIITAHREKAMDCGDLLSMLASSGGDDRGVRLSDEQLHDEMMTMLIAGTETTANTLSWVCHLLGQHPEVQERVRAEVDTALDGRPIGMEDLRKLGYTRQVLNETLRLYPAVWLLSRRPIADVELGGHRIPQGSHVLFSPYALHRDPTLYPEPERFQPERWSQEHAGAKGGSRETFIPFGAGLRGCIGEPYAWAEMLIFLSSLVTRWRLCPIAGRPVRPVIQGSLQPYQLVMRVEARAASLAPAGL